MSAPSELATDQLVRLYRDNSDAKLKEVLVKRHLPLVRHIAGSFSNRGEALDDLLQVGCIGLLRAIDRFDPDFGKTFDAYASTLISGEIKHYLRDFSALVRPPRELIEARKHVNDTIERISCDGTVPTLDQIALATGLSAEKVADIRALDMSGYPLSLDDTGEDREGPHYQLVDQKYKSFQLAAEDRIMLAQATARLRAVSREVIEFAFFQDLTQTEIAKMLGISQMQVSRRMKSAVRELWKILNSRLW
ncbi:MAG TPA: sigma-70 family RNA polymerase sigma factor [Chroococcales cyanobacterium]